MFQSFRQRVWQRFWQRYSSYPFISGLQTKLGDANHLDLFAQSLFAFHHCLFSAPSGALYATKRYYKFIIFSSSILHSAQSTVSQQSLKITTTDYKCNWKQLTKYDSHNNYHIMERTNIARRPCFYFVCIHWRIIFVCLFNSATSPALLADAGELKSSHITTFRCSIV